MPEPPRKSRGHPILAWLLIVLVCVSMAFDVPGLRRERLEKGQEKMGLVLTSLYARYLVGMADLMGNKEAALAQLKSLNQGPVEQRLAFAILVGELEGPTQALEKLDDLDSEIETKQIAVTETDTTIEHALRRLYRDYSLQRWDAPSLRADERELLRQQLGWFGELALAPPGDADSPARQAVLRAARQTFVVILGGLGLAVVACLAGLLGLIVFLALLLAGQLHGGLGPPSGRGGIYAETFAVWLVLLFGINLGAVWLSSPEADTLLLAGIASLVSLLALAWPVLRGVPWAEVSRDIGLVGGRQPALEPLIGAGCYAMALPMLVVGLAITVVLILLAHQIDLGAAGHSSEEFAPSPTPAHPIVGYVAVPGWRMRLEVFFVACIAAPLVEETMFRGVLYRHLRDATAVLGSVLSIALSATIMNFLFAGLHPQGPLAIPALMALAYGLTLAREWRVTLVPGMVAHGINNGLLLLFLSLAMS
jgi:membrane protease YdiL (CAAX protease family)